MDFPGNITLASVLGRRMRQYYDNDESSVDLRPIMSVGVWLSQYDAVFDTDVEDQIDSAARLEESLLSDWLDNCVTPSDKLYGMDWDTYMLFNTLVNNHFYSDLKDKLQEVV